MRRWFPSFRSSRARPRAIDFRIQPLEKRVLLSADGVPQEPLPTVPFQQFIIDDWDNDVTAQHFHSNYFAGLSGPLLETALSLAPQSNSGVGGSLRLTKGPGGFGGYFAYVGGRHFVHTTTHPNVAPTNVPVPQPWLDTHDLFNGFGGLEDRTVDQLRFDVNHNLASPLVIRIELKDDLNRIVSATRSIAATGAGWSTVSLNLPGDFSGAAGFDWRRLTHVVFVVDDAVNAPGWTFLVDNLRLVDLDGAYPDFAAMTHPTNGSLLPQYTDGFLDHLRRMTSLYFVDYASRFPGAAGMIQDISTSADLMTIGGVGFQLSSYVISAEREYLTRADAADRVVTILRQMHDAPQGTGSVGTIGYEGFFYHFLGIDGLRRQNFNAPGAIELSPIDTALAIAGVVTVGQYFDGGGAVEAEIRDLAHAIYSRVNWRFMLNDAPGAKQNQFFLAWKPETNDPGYQYNHPSRPGRFTGSSTDPLTVDFYTDEGVLMALLAMGSPNPAHRVGREAWDAIFRVLDPGADFIRTYPGSLFTYQFASAWLDTAVLGTDNHPTRPINFYENTRRAVQVTRNYALGNTSGRATWQAGAGATRWGLSAVHGPVHYANGAPSYFADAARPAALNINQNNPLEVGTVTVYAVGSAIVHEPQLAIQSLWHMARHEDLNQDGSPELLHPRFGFADAFNLNIADTAARGPIGPVIRPTATGPWANFDGLAIDHGPMVVIIDNYLGGQFVPKLFMSHDGINSALLELFPQFGPTVESSSFHFETAPHRLAFTFSSDVGASFDASDIVLMNLTTSQAIPAADLMLDYDAPSMTATFTYLPGALPDGRYRATLLKDGIRDEYGAPLRADHVFDFFFLRGDANRDGVVNLADFNILAANFGLSGASFSQGDFNYDGVVNLADFNILAARFGFVLPAQSSAQGGFGGGADADAEEDYPLESLR